MDKRLRLRVEAFQLADIPIVQRRVVLERLELAVVQPSRVFFYIVVLQQQSARTKSRIHTQHSEVHPRQYTSLLWATGPHSRRYAASSSGRSKLRFLSAECALLLRNNRSAARGGVELTSSGARPKATQKTAPRRNTSFSQQGQCHHQRTRLSRHKNETLHDFKNDQANAKKG